MLKPAGKSRGRARKDQQKTKHIYLFLSLSLSIHIYMIYIYIYIRYPALSLSLLGSSGRSRRSTTRNDIATCLKPKPYCERVVHCNNPTARVTTV